MLKYGRHIFLIDYHHILLRIGVFMHSKTNYEKCIMLLVFALILLVSLVRAGRLHPQVKKELDELQLVFGDLGIPHQDLTALATELATKADDADAEALLYRDFKRRLSDGKLRTKFDEKLRQLHQYNDFVEKLVEAIGGENIAEDSTNKATLNGELQALEEHMRKISEDVKHGNRNSLFVRLSNLLNEFEKNNSKRAFETTNLPSSNLKKLNVRNSDDTTADLEENSDRLSVKKTAISKDDQGQWIVNGKIWPKDSLHHIPKWLEDEYKERESKGETESLEEDGTRTTTLAVEDEQVMNGVVTNEVSRFNFYKQKIVASSEEENLRGAEIRTTKISAGTDVLTAGNNKDSADEESDSSGEKELPKEPRKRVVSETDDEMGEDERSGRLETSDEQGSIINGDSESSELGDINLHMQLASEMKLNKQPGEDSESVPWEATKKTLSEQKTDEGNGEQNKSSTTTSNIDEVDSMFSENPQTEKTKILEKFTENSTAASHSRNAEATSSDAASDEEHRSQKGRDWTNSEQISTSSTTRFLGFDGVNENDSPLQNETILDQVTQVSGTSFTTTDASLESTSFSKVLRQSEVSNESTDAVRNEAVAEGKKHQEIQTTASPEIAIDEGYTISQNTKANSIEDDGIEDISAVDVVLITTETTETTKIVDASAVSDTPFTEVTSVRTTKEKANESYDALGITYPTNDSLVIKNLSTELRVERDNEVSGRSEEVKASSNLQSELSKQHTSEHERIEEPLSDIDFQAVKAIFNMTALSNDMNITEYDGLAGDDTNIRNGTSTDYDMKELTLNEPNDGDGSGEEEIA